MNDTELTEEQFNLIKMFCAKHTIGLVCLHPVDSDPDNMKQLHIKNSANMKALVAAGFAKNVNDHEKIKEGIKYAKENNLRGFDVFEITEEAYNMFSAPNGSIN